ncbi:hypothetical protein ACSBQN_00225 [Morganella sp. B601]|uniref:hypothetical protein n=1 Tax=Morganella sp. B601 TaxID=3444315 RepID=UPI003EBFBB8B
MNYFIILTHSCRKLRKLVKRLSKYLVSLGFEKYPGKTFIGKVRKGFDWLGAPRALANHLEKVRRLYEQTRRWSKTKQTRRVLDYRNRWKILVVALAYIPTTYCDAITVAPGDTVRTDGTWTYIPGVPASPPTKITLAAQTPYGFLIKADVSTWPNCESKAVYPFSVTSDGYSGMTIANDVVLGLTGTATGPTSPDDRTSVVLGTWSEKGAYSTDFPNYDPRFIWCGRLFAANTTVVVYNDPAQFVGSWFVHAGPLAALGTYPNKPLALSRLARSLGSAPSTIIVPAGTVTVQPSTSCTVSSPDPNVQFGEVPARPGEDTQVLADYQSSIGVSCTSIHPGDENNIKISFSTTTPGRYTDTVALNDAAGTALAEIRGVMKAGPGTCDNDPDRIQFGAAYQYPVEAKEGTVPFPVTWYLCSNGSNARGEGSAKVTATLTWP